MEAIPPHPEPQSWRSHTQETLSSDDLPAEILVPTLLYNPLPLQCLAADALPIQIKEEIDQITSEYGDMDSEQLQVPAVSECMNLQASSNLSGIYLCHFPNAVTNINNSRNSRRRQNYARAEKTP